MLTGWYCRSMANQQEAQQDETDPNLEDESGSDEDSQEQQQCHSAPDVGGGSGNSAIGPNNTDYKTQYRYLKRKLKFLIYENEFFQDALRSNQRRLLKVSRDRAFLLDRLLQYEKPENTSSESDETESSEDEAAKEAKKRKQEPTPTASSSTRGRKKKIQPAQTKERMSPTESVAIKKGTQSPRLELELQQHGHMTNEEVERHLQSRQQVIELVQERAPATVPTEMFSNEPSLDSESNDQVMESSSPTHVAAEECVPMEYTA